MVTKNAPVSKKQTPAPKQETSKHLKFRGKLGVLLTEAREKRKLSQREIAKLLLIPGSPSTAASVVSCWEIGYRPVRIENDAQRQAVADFLGLKIPEFNALLKEDDIARARASARRNAKKAVIRQYQNPQAPKPVQKPVQKPVHNLEPADLSEPRKLPKADLKEAILLALVAGEPDLSDKAGDVRALMRVVNRFNSILAALATK